jgi:hypothetical protein
MERYYVLSWLPTAAVHTKRKEPRPSRYANRQNAEDDARWLLDWGYAALVTLWVHDGRGRPGRLVRMLWPWQRRRRQ